MMFGLTITENVQKAVDTFTPDQWVKMLREIKALKAKTKLPAQEAWDSLTEEQQLEMIASTVGV